MFDSVDRLTMTSPASFVNLNLDIVLLWLIYHEKIFCCDTCCVLLSYCSFRNWEHLFKIGDRATIKAHKAHSR